MDRNITILLGAVALLGGAALVVFADRQGWISSSQDAIGSESLAENTPPPKLAPFAIKPQASVAGPSVVLASSVNELAAMPRSQREASAECANAEKAVVFDDAAIAAAAGVRWQALHPESVTHSIACNAEIAFDGDRLAHVSSRASGAVKQVLKQAGDAVKAGDALALIDSSELGGAKASLLQSNALVRLWTENQARLKTIAGGAVTQQELIDSETSLTEARIELSRATQHLRNLGLTEADVEKVIADNDTTSTLSVVAPFDGIVIERHAVRGEMIETQTPLFMIADVTRMWAMLDIRESDIRNVHVGQDVQVTLPAMQGEHFNGKIEWISAAVDETTRTLSARASLANPGDALRAHMFGKGRIVTSNAQSQLVLPHEAVQWDGCCNLVFVRQTDAVFQPFKVRLGADLGDHYIVLSGLQDGDEVVTAGAFLLKTQLMKASIGAGCCEAGGKKE